MPTQAVTQLPLFTNPPTAWLAAAVLAAGTIVLGLALRQTMRRYKLRLQATEHLEWLELPVLALSRTTLVFLLSLGLFAGLQLLAHGTRTAALAGSIVMIALFWQVGLWATTATSAWFQHKRRTSIATDRASLGSLGIVGVVVSAVIWVLVALMTLDNLGIDVTALVAGLGIGGIAVALAVQNVLGDLFASLSIALDRPYVVGDFLSIGDFLGTVEDIGIKSTRLRSLSGEQIILSNSDLLSSRLRNYGRMQQRRVVLATGVTYETPAADIEHIPQAIRAIVERQEDVRFDRSHFSAHGDFALQFETVYYVLSADFNRHMDIQQKILLEMHREFDARGIQFAYPTQRLLLERQRPVADAGNADAPS
ncbi:mechanosensitive ion channel family protein [Tahibacter sp.]|uniref:mechanosensitive ion channel family protein n=1 Tax=Tahibacter sp. TaxID=2056211 RepID=UPI0028C3A9D9|nr:mechanosensitive ion channel family protein [Tahibacter sp.]